MRSDLKEPNLQQPQRWAMSSVRMLILSLHGLRADYVYIYQHGHKLLMHKTQVGISTFLQLDQGWTWS